MANAIHLLREPVLVKQPGLVYELVDPGADLFATTVAYAGCSPQDQLRACQDSSRQTERIAFDPTRNHFVSNLLLRCISPDTAAGDLSEVLTPDLGPLRDELAGMYAAKKTRLRLPLELHDKILGATEGVTIGELYEQLGQGRGAELPDWQRLTVAKLLSESGINAALIVQTLAFNYKLDIKEYLEDDQRRLSLSKYIGWLVSEKSGASPYHKVALEHALYKKAFVAAVRNWATLGDRYEGFEPFDAARRRYDPAVVNGQLPEPLL